MDKYAYNINHEMVKSTGGTWCRREDVQKLQAELKIMTDDFNFEQDKRQQIQADIWDAIQNDKDDIKQYVTELYALPKDVKSLQEEVMQLKSSKKELHEMWEKGCSELQATIQKLQTEIKLLKAPAAPERGAG